MLNDLFAIAHGMTAHGIDLAGRHPDIKDMAKGPALRIRLSADGKITGAEIVDEAGGGALWTLRDGNHNPFPGLKTAGGLLSIDGESRDTHNRMWDGKAAKDRRNELFRLLATHQVDLDQASDWPNMGHR
jgi:hypothetical protein